MLNTGCHSLEMQVFILHHGEVLLEEANIYPNGSYGCVNLPTYAAATLYKLVSQGDPVEHIIKKGTKEMRITMTDWIHRVLDEYIKEGDCCIDATMGKGGDTYYLCSKTGRKWKSLRL